MSKPQVSGPKLFTLAEAEAVLPLIRDRLARFQAVYAKYQEARRDLSVLRLVASSGGSEDNPDRDALLSKEKQIAAHLEVLNRIQYELLDAGCMVKSLPEGLVDFFALRGDRLVFLCWKQGEERIRYWHSIEGGFAGRVPIETFREEETPGEAG